MNNRRRKFIMDDILEEINEIMKGMIDPGFNPQSADQPLVWGFSMTQRGDEPPEIQEFGNIRLRDGGVMEAGHGSRPNVQMRSGEWKPLVDILEAEDDLHVVVEMPGVTKENITIESDGKAVDIKASREDRKYSEHVELPAKVLPDSAKATYNNGVLEVVFKYDKSGKKSIKLD